MAELVGAHGKMDVFFLSYYIAYFFRFDTRVPRDDLATFMHSWPVVLLAKCGAMWVFGVYRRSWWRGSTGDACRLAASGMIGELLALLVLAGLYGLSAYSPVVFLLDFALAWMFLVIMRRSAQLFRSFLRRLEFPDSLRARRVFVLGTSQHTELALRFLQAQKIECAGLIDTNGGSDLRRRVWGLKVVGQVVDLPRLAAANRVSEVILPENESMPCSELEFIASCNRDHLQVTRLGLHSLNHIAN